MLFRSLRSIIGELDSQKFARLRVGIGEPSRAAVDHVLSTFDGSERADLVSIVDAASDAVIDWARDGASRAANRWNPWQLHPPAPVERPAPPPGDGESALPHADGTPGALGGTPRSDDATPQSTVGADGIRHTRTGWRKPLPDPDARGSDPGRR